MSEQDNVRTVQEIYAAFGRGDIPAILDVVSPDVEWLNAGPAEIPYARQRRGLAEVEDFFQTLYATVEPEEFDPQEFLAQGERVIVLGRWSGRSKATGRRFDSAWAMAWTLQDGKVTGFRSYEDTEAVAAAFRA